jgi:hypothetical protein
MRKAFEQRRWRAVPKDELDAVPTRAGKLERVDKKKLRQAELSRIQNAKHLARRRSEKWASRLRLIGSGWHMQDGLGL